MKTRTEAIQNIEDKAFDVCVIGGGATGSACALEAQLRGLKTVQLEALDFASATSSTSTKMIHGGVRYLEQAIREFDVKEYEVLTRALRERIHMLRNAPFLAKTQRFLAPCFNWWNVFYFEIGLKLYDWIAGSASLAPSSFISRRELLHRMPSLDPRRLVGAVGYTDGQFDDARYNIALVKTFAEAGGETLNYARVTAFEKAVNGKITAVEVEDHFSQSSFKVRARAFINAAGPYADTIRVLATPGARPRMRLSKGVHILLPLEVLSSEDALLIPRTEDARVLFAIPWFGRLLVGTTEKEVNVDDELYVTREEVNYLLRHLNRYLTRPVTPDQIVSCTAGVRPLVSSERSKDTKKLAREHEVELDPQSGLISIMGGKWTTHRAMAEDTVNAVQEHLGGSATPSRTVNHPLVGSDGYSPKCWQSLVKEWGVSHATALHLVQKFGTRASHVLEIAKGNADLAAPLLDRLAPLCAEVVYSARNEMAASIEDVLARRIGLQLFSWKDAIQAAPAVAGLLAREFGWTDAATREFLSSYIGRIRGLMQKAGLSDGAALQRPSTSGDH
jgi:glycerol-3-phosphate dehydrogenase